MNFSDPELTESEFLRAADELFAAGTAVFLPTLITSPAEVYRRNLPLIRRAVERHGLAGAVPGIHLEGPFIARGAIGSHNPEWVQAPSPETVERLYQQAEGFVRLITVSADAPLPEIMAWHKALYGSKRTDVVVPLPEGELPQLPYWIT